MFGWSIQSVKYLPVNCQNTGQIGLCLTKEYLSCHMKGQLAGEICGHFPEPILTYDYFLHVFNVLLIKNYNGRPGIFGRPKTILMTVQHFFSYFAPCNSIREFAIQSLSHLLLDQLPQASNSCSPEQKMNICFPRLTSLCVATFPERGRVYERLTLIVLCDVTPFAKKYVIAFHQLLVRWFLSEALIGLNLKLISFLKQPRQFKKHPKSTSA